jgi:hypothetical protein
MLPWASGAVIVRRNWQRSRSFIFSGCGESFGLACRVSSRHCRFSGASLQGERRTHWAAMGGLVGQWLGWLGSPDGGLQNRFAAAVREGRAASGGVAFHGLGLESTLWRAGVWVVLRAKGCRAGHGPALRAAGSVGGKGKELGNRRRDVRDASCWGRAVRTLEES